MKFRLWSWSILFAVAMCFAACGNPNPSGENNNPDAGETPAESVAEKSSELSPDGGESVVESGPETTPEVADEPTPDEGTPDELAPEKEPETVPEEPSSKKTLVFVRNSDFVKGSFAVVDLKTNAFEKKSGGNVHGDSVAAAWGDWVFILNRYLKDDKEDEVVILQRKDWSVLKTIPVGKKTNPAHIAVVNATKAYVSLYGSSNLLEVDPTAGTVTNKIDLSSLAEKSAKSCKENKDCKDNFGGGSGVCESGVCQADGLPEMSQMLLSGKTLYLLIQGLDRNAGFKPVKSGIAVIDTETNNVGKMLELKGSNPVAFIPEPSGTYLIPELGSSFSPKDGGMERFDPAKGTLSGSFVLEEAKLGGTFAFTDVVVASASLAYVIVNDAKYKQTLLQVDLSNGSKKTELIQAGSLSGLALTPNGVLLVGDKTKKGIRFFDAKTGKEMSTEPLVSGDVPPAQILVLPMITP